jgi:PleD family two-component response regulator
MSSILIVDDDENNIFLIRCFLEKEKFTVFEAASGLQALEVVNEEPHPDLIILDIMMPEMDGYEVCQALKAKEETRHIPVIMLTARNTTEDMVRGLNCGASDYITKPVNFEELTARIRTHLRIKQLERESVKKEKLESILQMSVSMRHELNNPLTGVLGMAELLAMDEDMPKAKRIEMATIIRDQSIRIREIVQKMSRITDPVAKGSYDVEKMIDIHKSVGE